LPARAYRCDIGYQLEAIVTPSSVARVVAAALPGTRPVELGSGLALVPLVPEAVAILSPGDERIISLLMNEPLPDGLTDLLRHSSETGPIAYVEAEYFGRVGIAAAHRDHRVGGADDLVRERLRELLRDVDTELRQGRHDVCVDLLGGVAARRADVDETGGPLMH
jgi:hypothetical protein